MSYIYRISSTLSLVCTFFVVIISTLHFLVLLVISSLRGCSIFRSATRINTYARYHRIYPRSIDYSPLARQNIVTFGLAVLLCDSGPVIVIGESLFWYRLSSEYDPVGECAECGELLVVGLCRPANERTCSSRPLFRIRAWCSCAFARRHAIELFLEE